MMKTPESFAAMPPIAVVDPLAELLGAAAGGVVGYRCVEADMLAGLVTGAANVGGHKGLAGRFARSGLLRFGVPMHGEIRFTCIDDGRPVELLRRARAVLRPEGLGERRRAAVQPPAFAEARQGWVRAILFEHADDPALIDTWA